MAKVASEGKVKVYWLPAVASLAAPTVANIAAGVNVTPFLPTSGVGIEWTQNNATIDMLDDSFRASAIGTEEADIQLTFTRDNAADTAWDLWDRAEQGYLLVSRFGSVAAGAKVEVYPCEAHRPVPMRPASNEFQQATVKLAVNASPNLEAVVAA